MVFMAFMTSNEPTCVPPTRYLGPRSPKIGPRKGQNPQVWPILAYFGLFGPKGLGKIFGLRGEKKSIFFCSKSLLKAPQRVWHPQKPQIRVRDPPGRPVWARFVGKMAQIGVKKRVFFKKIFFDPYHSRKVPGGSGTLKNAKLTHHGPKNGPVLRPFCV